MRAYLCPYILGPKVGADSIFNMPRRYRFLKFSSKSSNRTLNYYIIIIIIIIIIIAEPSLLAYMYPTSNAAENTLLQL
jgi:hypothetical protein